MKARKYFLPIGFVATLSVSVLAALAAVEINTFTDISPTNVCDPLPGQTTPSGNTFASQGVTVTESNCDSTTGERDISITVTGGSALLPGQVFISADGTNFSVSPDTPQYLGSGLADEFDWPLAADLVNVETDNDWYIAATGIFNNDLETDILWANDTTDEQIVHLMSGDYVTLELDLGSFDGNGPLALMDFDQDGVEDDVLYEATSTSWSVREYQRDMNGLPEKGTTTSLMSFSAGTRLIGVGDFDEDGYNDDFVYRDNAGTMFIKLTEAGSVTGTHNLGAEPSVTGGTGTLLATSYLGVMDYDDDGFEDDIVYAGSYADETLLKIVKTDAQAKDGSEVSITIGADGSSDGLTGDGGLDGILRIGIPGTTMASSWEIIDTTSVLITDLPQNLYSYDPISAALKSDIFLYKSGTDGDYVLTSRGDGSFITGVDIEIDGVFEVYVGDFAGDEKEDLFFYAPGTDGDYILTSDGDGTFTTGVNIGLDGVFEVYVGNFAGDAKDDLFLYAAGTDGDYVLTSDGDGTFTTGVNVAIDGIFDVYIGNFAGDAKDDLFLYAPGTDGDYVFTSDGDGTFTIGSNIGLDGTYNIYVGDFAGDAKEDLFLYQAGSGADNVLTSDGDGTFTTGVNLDIGGTFEIHVGDFAGDTKDDLFFYQAGSGADNILTSDGDGTFTTGVNLDIGGTFDVYVGDFAGDENDDLFLYQSGVGFDNILISDGDGTVTTSASLGIDGVFEVYIGDFSN
ncbi:MAG: hypothetical protein AAGA83_00220 [Cyanobacteria bacterium P01_F01_bin.116]